MTAEERQLIRNLIDKTVRERVKREDNPCGGCGGNRDHITAGCDACRRRHNNRRRAEMRDRMLAAIGPCVGIDPRSQVRLAMSNIRMPRRVI